MYFQAKDREELLFVWEAFKIDRLAENPPKFLH